MKKIILLILFSVNISAIYSQSLRTVWQTTGENYIITPGFKGDKELNVATYAENIYDKKYLPLSKAGSVLKLISIDRTKKRAVLVDSAGAKYIAFASNEHDRGGLSGLASEVDLIKAKTLYLNKTLWLNVTEVFTGDPLNLENVVVKIPNMCLEPVKIISISLCSFTKCPYVFTFLTPKGETAYLNVNISGIGALNNKDELFESLFFTENPKLKYKFDAKTWSSIKNKVAELGMSPQAVLLIEGYPETMNNSKVTGGLDQWVYSAQYFYFRNNKLVDIRSKN